jgi:ABC-type amino acid transport substrate-binding protein
MKHRRWALWLAGAVALALVASACSDDDDDASSASTAASGETTGATIELTQSSGSTLQSILDKKVLTVGMTLQFEPEMYLDDNDQPAGYDVELVKKLAEDLGVELKIENQEFDALIPGLLAGRWDMISVGLVPRPPRLLQMYFTDAYVPYEQVLAVPADDDNPPSIDSYNKSGVNITALQGATAAEQVKTQFPNATLKEFPQQDAAFLEVASGRAQAIVVESYLADGFIAANPGQLKVVPLPAPLQIEYGSWAIPKGDSDFLIYLNSWLQYYKNNGFLDQTYVNIFKSDPNRPIWARG